MRACRICITKNDLAPLFGDFSAVRFSSDQLFNATGVQIKPNDGLPQFACKSCIELIKSSLHLRTISQLANINLRLMLQKSTLKTGIFDDNDIFTNDNPTDDSLNDSYHDQNDVSIKVEMVNSANDNSDQYFTNKQSYDLNDMTKDEKPIISYNNNNKTRLIEKRKMRKKVKRKKMRKMISIDDLESNDSNDIGNCQENGIKIEDLESDTEIDVDFNITKSLVSDINNYGILSKKYKSYDRHNNVNDSLNNDSDIKFNSNDIPNNKTTNNMFIKNNNITKRKCYDSSKFNVKNMKLKTDYVTNDCKMERRRCNKNNEKLYSLASKPQGESIQCKKCKLFVKRTSFRAHASTHFEPEFTCEDCGKQFRSRPHMSYHQQRLHGRLKRLACTKCDYRTVSKRDLINHDRITHSGERPYICDICNASFPMRNNIIQHLRRHFGVKNVQCDKCPKMFVSKSRLWSHQHKVHFDDYNYHCYLCPEKYKGAKAVRRHIINVHGIPEDQQLKIKYVRTKKITEVPEISTVKPIASRSYVKNAELN